MNKITFHGKRGGLKKYNTAAIKALIQRCLTDHNKRAGHISYIIVSDDDLLKINQTHLQHDYFTDIITFDLSSNTEIVDADIYISQDRVTENSTTYGDNDEMLRVCIHGALHLCGYKDKTKPQAKKMRSMEDHYITLYRQNEF